MKATVVVEFEVSDDWGEERLDFVIESYLSGHGLAGVKVLEYAIEGSYADYQRRWREQNGDAHFVERDVAFGMGHIIGPHYATEQAWRDARAERDWLREYLENAETGKDAWSTIKRVAELELGLLEEEE